MKRIIGILTLLVGIAVGIQAEIKIETIENGTVTATQDGTTVTLTVTPATGYYITANDITVTKTSANSAAESRSLIPSIADKLTVTASGEVAANGAGTYTFTLPEGYGARVEAKFTIYKYTLTLKSNPSNGKCGHLELDSVDHALPAGVVASGDTPYKYIVDHGTTVKINAIPAEHNHLASWNNTKGNDLQQIVTMIEDRDIVGVFAIDTFTLTLIPNAANMGTCKPTRAVKKHITSADSSATSTVTSPSSTARVTSKSPRPAARAAS